MPKDLKRIEYRVRESWRARACAAGLSVGAQTFLFGTGVAMPLALNSAWIAAFAMLPVAALVTAACRKKNKIRNGKKKRSSRAAYALLTLTLLGNCVFAVAALVNFAEQTLLELSPMLWSIVVTVIAVSACALSGGDGAARLCFALRWALPVLSGVLVLASVPMKTPVGLFPLLGKGGAELGVSAACMLGAASPAVMLLLPPLDIARGGEAANACPAPKTGFFVRRVLAGAAIGVLFLFAACVCTTYESIAESAAWGMRLRIVASDQPHEGIPQTLLVVLQMLAILLLGANMLSSAEQALVYAFPKGKSMRSGLLILTALLLAALLLLLAFGFDIVLYAAPLLAVPALILPGLCRSGEGMQQ